MNICAHVLCYNEEEILKYSLRHYTSFCNRVVVHDLGSKDDSVGIARFYECDVMQHDCKGEFDDRLNKQIKEESWKGRSADWIIQADADELIYFPSGSFASFSAYDLAEIPVVKPHGFEMFSDSFPQTDRQIYDEIKMGASDDFWYAKPVIFSATRVKSIVFGTGAHWCEATLLDGRKHKALQSPPVFTNPPCFLLHFHHIGGLERIARRYDENQKRQSAMNKKMRWGNMEDPLKHAKDKRAMIMSKLQQVIP